MNQKTYNALTLPINSANYTPENIGLKEGLSREEFQRTLVTAFKESIGSLINSELDLFLGETPQTEALPLSRQKELAEVLRHIAK